MIINGIYNGNLLAFLSELHPHTAISAESMRQTIETETIVEMNQTSDIHIKSISSHEKLKITPITPFH